MIMVEDVLLLIAINNCYNQLLGKTNVEIFKVQRRQESLKSVIERCAFAYVVGMNGENVNSILRKAENMDLVWIDGSCYGTIAKELKQKKL